MSFSQRLGLEPVWKPIQLSSMDDELKNSLWNVFYVNVLQEVQPRDSYKFPFITFRFDYLANFLKAPVHNAPEEYDKIVSGVESCFFNATWNGVYDLLDFFLDKEYVNMNYGFFLNKILEREFSGFRVINNLIVPISNEWEIESINQTLDYGSIFTGFDGINIHLNKALNFLSDRENPDYSASIRESITAVETAAKLITKEGSLGNALNKLEQSGLEINKQLKESFSKIYNYTNDKASGIRHAVVENHQPPNFETAKFLLINSSAFINYLMSLYQKAGVAISTNS